MLFAETARSELARSKDPLIKQGFVVQVPLLHQKSLVKTKCPECKTSVGYYSDGTSKDHPCTVCGKVVTI